jgi:hypothetical protein
MAAGLMVMEVDFSGRGGVWSPWAGALTQAVSGRRGARTGTAVVRKVPM